MGLGKGSQKPAWWWGRWDRVVRALPTLPRTSFELLCCAQTSFRKSWHQHKGDGVLKARSAGLWELHREAK